MEFQKTTLRHDDLFPTPQMNIKSYGEEMLTWAPEGAIIGAILGFTLGASLYPILNYMDLEELRVLQRQSPTTFFIALAGLSAIFGASAGALVGIGTPKFNAHAQQGGLGFRQNIVGYLKNKPLTTKENKMATMANETLTKAKGVAQDFKNGLDDTGNKLEKFSRGTGERIGEMASELADATRNYAETGREYVKEHPVTGVAIAAATGFVVGSILTKVMQPSKH